MYEIQFGVLLPFVAIAAVVVFFLMLMLYEGRKNEREKEKNKIKVDEKSVLKTCIEIKEFFIRHIYTA
jgi:predicted membrane protein